MVDNEIKRWLASIIQRSRYVGKDGISEVISRNLSGVNISFETVKAAVKELDVKEITEQTAIALASLIMKKEKPMLILCNKMDSVEDINEKIDRLRKRFDYEFMPCSAAAELTIKEAEKKGFIKSTGSKIERLKPLSADQERAITIIEKITTVW